MKKVKLAVIESRCRSGYCKKGDEYILEDDICPSLCMELWNNIYPYVFALKNDAQLDCGLEKTRNFTAKCTDENRVCVYGEVIDD